MKYKYFAGIFQFMLLAGVYQPVALADYVFTSAPRENVEESITVYQPIVDFLTKVTGEKFVLRNTSNWTDYTIAMKNQEFDVVFDGAIKEATSGASLNFTISCGESKSEYIARTRVLIAA